MGLHTLSCLLLLALAIRHQLISDRVPERLTSQKVVALDSYFSADVQYWYLRVWMYVVTAATDMKQLAITTPDNKVISCQWQGSTFTVNSGWTSTTEDLTAFELNKWTFMEFFTQSNKSLGRRKARDGGMLRLLMNGNTYLPTMSRVTMPITASAFEVITK